MATLDQDSLVPARTCACRMLRSLSRRATRWYESHLSDLDLTAGQFTLLVVVQVRAPVSAADVGRRIGADRTTLYRMVKPLRERGLDRGFRGS